MARPFKDGLDYFSLDVGFLRDPKIRKLLRAKGYLGVLTYLSVISHIYRDKGYYAIYDSEFVSEVTDDLSGNKAPDLNVVSSVIEESILCGLLLRRRLCENSNNDITTERRKTVDIITSKRVQEQFLLSTKRRKNVKVDGKIWLLSQSEMQEILGGGEPCLKIINVDINGVNVDINEVNADINTQRESKKEIEKESEKEIEKNITTTTTCQPVETSNENELLCPPDIYVVHKYFYERCDNTEAIEEGNKFYAYNALRGWDCLPNWELAADLWIARMKDFEPIEPREIYIRGNKK